MRYKIRKQGHFWPCLEIDEAEEEIGRSMEQEIIKEDHLKRKLCFLQGGDIEDDAYGKEGGECVSGLSQYLATLKS